MVSNASELFPDPDSPVITTSASRGRLREMSLRLCSRAPETTICSPAAISSAFYDPEQMFAYAPVARSWLERPRAQQLEVCRAEPCLEQRALDVERGQRRH